jgi:hypothetical protein
MKFWTKFEWRFWMKKSKLSVVDYFNLVMVAPGRDGFVSLLAYVIRYGRRNHT